MGGAAERPPDLLGTHLGERWPAAMHGPVELAEAFAATVRGAELETVNGMPLASAGLG